MKEYKTFMEGKVLEKRRNVVNHRTTEYQYGSAVRKLQSVPEIHTYEHERRIEEQEQERRQRRREIRRNNSGWNGRGNVSVRINCYGYKYRSTYR